jgi:hypothetical protein
LYFNSADDDFDGTFHSNIIVNYKGEMKWIPPGMFKSTCQIDIAWFPFDEQKCDLKFGSWTYDGRFLDLIFDGTSNGDYTDFIRNGEWELLGYCFNISVQSKMHVVSVKLLKHLQLHNQYTNCVGKKNICQKKKDKKIPCFVIYIVKYSLRYKQERHWNFSYILWLVYSIPENWL